MNFEYPYQIVAFLDAQPAIGEPVYYGDNGWFAQIALKRRFKTVEISEDELLSALAAYCNTTPSFAIQTKDLARPDRMPVQVLEVEPTSELMDFHAGLISFLGKSISSRYPERDGDNYLPHITAEFDGQLVIDHEKYSNREFLVDRVFLLKDIHDENSIAIADFALK